MIPGAIIIAIIIVYVLGLCRIAAKPAPMPSEKSIDLPKKSCISNDVIREGI